MVCSLLTYFNLKFQKTSRDSGKEKTEKAQAERAEGKRAET